LDKEEKTVDKRKKAREKIKQIRNKAYDVETVIEHLMEWVEEESSINFANFCFLYGIHPQTIWRWQKQHPEFDEAYTLAKLKLAERRERQVNAEMINYGSFMRYQSGYDAFLLKDEDEAKDKDAKRRKGIAESEQANLVLLAKLAADGKISQKD
jgi:hypothetical protein